MRVLLKLTLFLALFVFAISCAKTSSENRKEIEQEALDAWMALNINTNGNTVAEKLESGMYIEWLNKEDNTAVKPITGDWLEINYTVRSTVNYLADEHRGTVLMTRNENIARQEGTFSSYTHYVPQFLIHNDNNNIFPGQQQALKMMRKGDIVRLYMPSTQTTEFSGLTYSNGYEGTGTLNSSSVISVPLIMEMELVEVVSDPSAREERWVKEYAMSNWNKGEFDTIREFLYIDIIDYIEGADTIGADSILTLNYTGSFVTDEEFIFDTSIDSIATKYNRNASSGITMKPANRTNIDAFYEVFASREITYGMHFRMVFTSKYGYGSEGNSGSTPSTIIQPYDPLIFDVYVTAKADDEEEDDE